MLTSDEAAAKSAEAAPKKSDITRWDLSELINVAVELKKVSVGVERLSNSIREYRNLIHPSREIRNELNFGAEEAKIAIRMKRQDSKSQMEDLEKNKQISEDQLRD